MGERPVLIAADTGLGKANDLPPGQTGFDPKEPLALLSSMAASCPKPQYDSRIDGRHCSGLSRSALFTVLTVTGLLRSLGGRAGSQSQRSVCKLERPFAATDRGEVDGCPIGSRRLVTANSRN